MTSRRKDERRGKRWMRYIELTSRTSVRHCDYPFGLSIKITPSYYALRRSMRHRGRDWYVVKKMTEEMFQ